MNNPRHASRNYSSEDIEDIEQCDQDYNGECTLGLEKFFLAMDSGEDEEIVQSLILLSEELTLTEEQILISQPLDKALNLLINCLNKNHPELLLQSMTCVKLILDTQPDLSEVIIECGGLSIICEKIGNYSYIELCEQAIRTLEKISLEYPLEVLEAKVIKNCLNMIDCLDSDIQKKILNIMCNAIKALQTEESAKFQILPIIPRVLELIQNNSNLSTRVEKVLEFIVYFVKNLLNIISSKGSFKDYAKSFVEFGLLNVLLEIFPIQSDYILRLLFKLCEHSAIIVKKFLSIGGLSIIKNEIESHSMKNVSFTRILKLLDSILPVIPPSDPLNKAKQRYFSKDLRHMQEISELILPRTKSIAEKFVSKEDKSIMISILEKILKISNVEMITQYLTCQSFSTFLSELMASKDLSIVRAALRISLTLYEKIPSKISGNFTREGVIARINHLKEAERLKEFKKLPKNKFGGNFDEIVFRPNELKNPYQIETMLNKNKTKMFKTATLDDYKKELLIYVKKILDKHKNSENKKAPRIGKEIKQISQKLASCFGESAYEILVKITQLFNSIDKLSFYEISNSSIADSLWKWLSEANTEKQSARISEFLRIFTKDSAHSDSFYQIILKYMIGTANFVHHFRILLHDYKALSVKRNQKVKIVLEYSGTDQYINDESYKVRHDMFSSNYRLKFNSSVLLTFEKLRELLIRISNQTDLYTLLQQKIISETTVHMFLDRPYAANYQIIFINGTKEVNRSSTVLNLAGKKSQLHLKFRIVEKTPADLQFKYLKNPAEILAHMINDSSNVGIEQKDKSYPYLRLTKFLYNLSEFFPNMSYLLGVPNMHKIPFENFYCSKLSALLNRQLQDFVSTEGNTPATWIKTLPLKSKYLFSSDARFNYLEGFGLASISEIEKKHKVKVRRENIMKDALFILNDTGLHMETVLEVEYEDEIGTGIGPTVEFFTLVSTEIKNLNIWRKMCEESGLFPAPLSEIDPNWEALFRFIGTFIGKAIIDKRHIDFQLSPALWKLVFNQAVTMLDLQSVDKGIGKHLLELNLHPNDAERTGLVFTLPGYDYIELKPDGSNILVNKSNLEEYTYLCAVSTLNQLPQAKALRKGLDSIIPVEILSILTISEIEDLILGENESLWELETLKQHILPAYGYTENSKTFINLLTVLSKFDNECKKKFLEFVTGSPRLPAGGFEKLQPKLSVVKKDVSDNPDSALPSVMTCQNYLKIPDYSNILILEQKLLTAINEGRQAFHLS